MPQPESLKGERNPILVNQVKNPLTNFPSNPSHHCFIYSMREVNTRVLVKEKIESKFIFSKEITNISSITDAEGEKLAFSRTEEGNQIIFTHDTEGVEVAVEHTMDGGKVFHLSEDSKGLPAMHEFKHDGSEIMYLLDANKKLEKSVESTLAGDKIATWYYDNGDVLMQEERQTGGTLFRYIRDNNQEALIWLKIDGSADAHGEKELIERIQLIFRAQLDGVIF